MNQTFADGFSRLQAVGKKVDPYGLFALEGGQAPSVFGGYDYAKLVPAIDVLEIYNIGCNDEIIRSFATERTKKLTCYFGHDKLTTSFMWYQLLHGDRGQIHWDYDQKGNGTFIEKPGRKITVKARNFAPTMRELTRGGAEQIFQCERVPEQIAVHYSQASINANWLLDVIKEGDDWIMRDSEDEIAKNPNLRVRYSWVKLIEDIGHQFRFLSNTMIENDALVKQGFRVLILPQSFAISDAESIAIKRFARRGGTVIADNRAGIMDGHCKRVKRGQLDDLFGIKRSDIVCHSSETIIDKMVPNELFTVDRLELPVVETAVKQISADSLGKASGVSALYTNVYGDGLAVLLNANMEPYIVGRLNVDSLGERTPQRMLQDIFTSAGVCPDAIARTGTDRHPPGWELISFDSGDARLVALVLNELRRYGGLGEELEVTADVFAGKHKVNLTLDRRRYVYDSRAGKYLGNTDHIKTTIEHLVPKLIWCLPYEVEGLKLAARQVRRKVRLKAELKVIGNVEIERHVIRFDVYDPDGEFVHYYGANVVSASGVAEHMVSLALDDKPGVWRVHSRDQITGLQAEAEFEVTAG